MSQHYGYCNTCQKRAPASYKEQGNEVLLVKNCPTCGRTETIISTDAPEWRAKRAIDRLAGDKGCSLDCTSCANTHTPMTVFVDITNRCNMDCPICIANIPGMGFKFEPPFEYFRKLFDDLSALDPRPSIKLFGGEPTVRKDLPEIIGYARSKGLSTSIVTNGLRFTDEEYCREILKTKAKLIFAFDGQDPAIYKTLRGHEKYYEQKLKALDNIRKVGRAKVTLMCVVAKGLNDHLMPDLFRFCHERSDIIKACEFIPLTRTWIPGTIEADGADITAIEDAEKIVAAGVPGGRLEFLPAGLSPFKAISRYLPIPRLTFAGAHPNCESVTFLVSDGKEYRPITDYLKGRSLYNAVEELIQRDEAVGRRMAKIEKGIFGKLGMAKLIGRGLSLMAIGGAVRKGVDTQAILGRNATLKILRIGWGLLLGRKAKDVLRANTKLQTILRVVVLPFEEPRTLDSTRLLRCPAAFAYEDPDTRATRTIPVCAWGMYKDGIMRRIMANYFPESSGNAPAAKA